MTLVEHPALSRAAALALLVGLVVLFGFGPLASYVDLLAANSEALAAKMAVLQRYRLLTTSGEANAAAPAAPSLLYPEMPESQASALLQETVKTTAAAARVQVQGLQVLRGEAPPGSARIGVRVRASGDIASLRGFLYAIETARPLLHPDNLQIQSHSAAPGAATSVLDFQLDVSAFKAEPRS